MCKSNIAPLFDQSQSIRCFDPELQENKEIVAECYESIGFTAIAKSVLSRETGSTKLCDYVKSLYFQALQLRRHDVIERLQFASLVYG